MFRRIATLTLVLLGVTASAFAADPPRPRARDLGIAPGIYRPGIDNAITDVRGVKVGHVTLRLEDDVRTGVTAILPHSGDLYQQKVPAAIEVYNGYGKLIGYTQVRELGQIETPILLTNTLSVWDAAAAMAAHMLARPGNENVRSINPVVGETNDGRLNDIRGRHLGEEHFLNAIEWAREGPVGEGSVGAGTGTMAFGYKGGIGTSSRRLPREDGGYSVGVLVQTNFGGHLTVGGVPVWRELAGSGGGGTGGDAGSCMIVVATDAPLTSRQLGRLARRSFAGMARTGGSFGNGSGDYAIAFSAATEVRIPHEGGGRGLRRPVVLDANLSPLFVAVAEATEEAILNSILQARRVCGVGGICADPVPIGALRKALGLETPETEPAEPPSEGAEPVSGEDDEETPEVPEAGAEP